MLISLSPARNSLSYTSSEEELKGVTLIAGAKPGTNIILTYFRWGSGGNTVLVTGTFTKWIHHVPLHRERNIWTTTIVSVYRFRNWKGGYICKGSLT